MPLTFVCLENFPRMPPPERRSDMCETCESYRQDQNGHDTWLAWVPGSNMTNGTHIWFCSIACFELSPVPTIDDPLYPEPEKLRR